MRIIIIFIAVLAILSPLSSQAMSKKEKRRLKAQQEQADYVENLYAYDKNGNLVPVGKNYVINKNLSPKEKATRRKNIQKYKTNAKKPVIRKYYPKY